MELFELVINLILNFLVNNEPAYSVYGTGVYLRNGKSSALVYGTFINAIEGNVENTIELYAKNSVSQVSTSSIMPLHYTLEYI